MASKTYSELHDEQLLDKYFELQKKLPDFLYDYFEHIASLLPSTRLNYATDLGVFLIDFPVCELYWGNAVFRR